MARCSTCSPPGKISTRCAIPVGQPSSNASTTPSPSPPGCCARRWLSCTRPCSIPPACRPRCATWRPPRRVAGHLTVDLDVTGWPAAVRTSADSLLLSTARELLTNVVKHAEADRAEVRLRLDGAVARLWISDNGKGMAGVDLEAPTGRSPSGTGLAPDPGRSRGRTSRLRGCRTAGHGRECRGAGRVRGRTGEPLSRSCVRANNRARDRSPTTSRPRCRLRSRPPTTPSPCSPWPELPPETSRPFPVRRAPPGSSPCRVDRLPLVPVDLLCWVRSRSPATPHHPGGAVPFSHPSGRLPWT